MKSFPGVLIFFSILYGAGTGITMSSNALALNTYFKKKRRIATGLSWTCTGIGPIVMPQIITLLMPVYGVEGTIFIFGGFTFNAVVCALLLQPVSEHVKRRQAEIIDKKYQSLENIDGDTRNSLSLVTDKFGSQYLYYDDKEDGASGIDVIGPETSMMSRANDGWFSRKNTSTTSISSKTSKKESSSRNLSRKSSVNLSRQSSLNRESSVRNLNSRRKVSILPLIIVKESCEHTDDYEHCKDPNCNHKIEEKLVASEEIETDQLMREECAQETTKKTFLETLIIFFDLDLLSDYVYVNMMLGITFANFSEMNFAMLTPFILGEYGFSKIQVATVMSILGSMDVATRLIIPFVADFIGWQNRTFFLVGVCGMAAGRVVLAHVQDFGVILAVAVLIGAGKALRTIFMALVIPTHVPLSRLPGATGIQLLTSGIISLTLGPVVGWIRDITANYAIMLHCLNIFTYLTVISWSLEICFTKREAKKIAEEESNKLKA
ncbi:Monocarboxylate transporter 14 [Habropoda laboriosa]|uniref:Monocarboxylate transporter 14 n=1 Tax=Habropoda laboriosa TaxID=597456 RepID=A0A0L7QW96_9HYME|nr:Monocarboxylate transporter 14 [Habropoda laboriosa]